ncbi:flagellar biosynthesis protein FlhA [Roseobacter sp. HKCCD9010]|uniref:flagellar biosynthesis protein FlhA n=1 Tax=unclassified Roseobacter TaxID=196798 RepID=UPI001492C6E3|nr:MULTISPECIES: flagellar biosynthesis protein FlhA [unclassified Roseobacter]MBF9050979.1 flagellar biosynthesis protein FlhA [Rhodobacterales bacterium HKCCD4356]NNV12748.1 flagellar biosynthesis protein FlhA [Roseobacter sp. HKCCD7357]NNV16692.1 flagellar biosynthesis protein FlhA [Roseobacter sp. HKCCD8768]NNV26676.1 flagellar biosynthesis protein FlhA [Roseobacter sp. HKCCD8192]NNV30411.1 flagellar biosynthesis protein FlhA [Roseobacter sp. HKCCD9061]
MATLRTIFQPTILLALALMAVIVMMILPVPSWILDIGLAASFGLAILIFTVTLFVERPLDFSSFPTILLASLMLRLSLNVSSTKLIIGEGHTGTSAAGGVIEGFAMFVMGGSVVMGLVIFGVLLIVNFIVINKGAARMAEVGARFALDGMPGKQLAIDADMSAGAIDHTEAKERREREQAETTFFGSLDGASKFVKGDAIAGLLITLLNLVMGLIIGTVIHDMPLGQAFETYSILTVGDGLVSQIPAVIIAIASALLLARGGATGATDSALVGQLGKHPSALATVAVLMAVFALVPGLPFLPFLIGAAALGTAAALKFSAMRRASRAEPSQGDKATEAPAEEKIGDVLDLDEIHVEFAPDLVSLALDPATGLDARIRNMRDHVARNFGVILPEMRLTDRADLSPGTYAIRIQGVEHATDWLDTNGILVLKGDGDATLPPGQDVDEPVYGAPARWVSTADREQVALLGLTTVAPSEVLATHLLEVLKRNLSRLLSFKALQRQLDAFVTLSDPARAEENRRLLEELIPDKVPLDLLHAVLRLLLAEQVSIRNLPLILEAIAEIRPATPQPDLICEHVRQRLGFQLIAELRRPDGSLPLIQLAGQWEDVFQQHQMPGEAGLPEIALPPETFNNLAKSIGDKVTSASENGTYAAVVTSALRRRFVRTVLTARGITNPVLSFEEIGLDGKPALMGLAAP